MVKQLKTLPLNEMLPYVTNVANVPDNFGYGNAAAQLAKVTLEAENIIALQKNASTNQAFLTGITLNYFSNLNALKKTFENLVIANSKNGLTDKIYVSTDVDVLEV